MAQWWSSKPRNRACEVATGVSRRREVKANVTTEVTFLLTPGLTRAEQRAAAEHHLGAKVSRLCPHCGNADHGRPRLPERQLSLAYAAGLVAIAVSEVPVGVDVERDGFLAWTRAEAVLKLTGEGVRRDPATVRHDDAWTLALAAPPGYVATLAAAEALEVSLRTETAAAPARPATDATPN
jgi:phosphopantetheinyl transferase